MKIKHSLRTKSKQDKMEEDLRRQEYSDDIGGKEERNEYK
jgi:hypothetical protein